MFNFTFLHIPSNSKGVIKAKCLDSALKQIKPECRHEFKLLSTDKAA